MRFISHDPPLFVCGGEYPVRYDGQTKDMFLLVHPEPPRNELPPMGCYISEDGAGLYRFFSRFSHLYELSADCRTLRLVTASVRPEISQVYRVKSPLVVDLGSVQEASLKKRVESGDVW